MHRKELLQIGLISLGAGFGLSYRIPGETLNIDLWFEIFLTSLITVFLIYVISYFVQQKLATFFSSKIEYQFNPLGLVATIIVPILFSGFIPFFMVGPLRYDKLKGIGTKKPLHTKVERAAIVGIQTLIALFIASVTSNEFVINAAVWFAIWTLIPIPRTNGYTWFDWHPANTLILTSFVALIIFLKSLYLPMIIPFVVFAIYYFSYVFVMAKRINY